MKKALTLILIFLAVTAIAQEETAFERGVEAYRQHEYEQALEHFSVLLDLKFSQRGSALYYNLGNCYYRLQQPGQARYYYEMALLADPGNDDARHNIEVLEQAVLNPEMYAANFAGFEVTLFRLLELARPGWMFWLGALAFLVINILVFIRLIQPGRLNATLLWLLLIPLGLVLLASASIVAGYHLLESELTFGIIVGQNEYAYSEPSVRAPGKFPIPEAAKARIKRQQEEWIEISLPDKTTGWIMDEDIAIIGHDSD